MGKKKISKKSHPCRTSPWTLLLRGFHWGGLHWIAICHLRILVQPNDWYRGAMRCMKLQNCKIPIFQWFPTSSYSGLFHPSSLPSCHDSSCCLFVPQICKMSICKLQLFFGSLSDKRHFPMWLASWNLPSCEALPTWCSIGSYRWQLTVGGVRQALSPVVSGIHGILSWRNPPTSPTLTSSRLEFVTRHVFCLLKWLVTRA